MLTCDVAKLKYYPIFMSLDSIYSETLNQFYFKNQAFSFTKTQLENNLNIHNYKTRLHLKLKQA